MSQNVARRITKPAALPIKWRYISLQATARRNGSEAETQDEPSDELSLEHKERRLRVADQTSLRNYAASVRALQDEIEESKKRIASTPKTIQGLPDIPPYSIGYPRQEIFEPSVKHADKAIEHGNTLLEHIKDLQIKPYPKEGDEDDWQYNFMLEMQERDVEVNEEMLRTWENELLADRSRLEHRAESLKNDMKMMRGGVVRKSSALKESEEDKQEGKVQDDTGAQDAGSSSTSEASEGTDRKKGAADKPTLDLSSAYSALKRKILGQ
jgi:hypothetical protein